MTDARTIADTRLAKGEITAAEHSKIISSIDNSAKPNENPEFRGSITSGLGWFCWAFIAFLIAYFLKHGTMHVIFVLGGVASVLIGILMLVLPRGK